MAPENNRLGHLKISKMTTRGNFMNVFATFSPIAFKQYLLIQYNNVLFTYVKIKALS